MTTSNNKQSTASNLRFTTLCVTFAILLGACGTNDPLSPGLEFMPDMYRGVSYETYGTSPVFADSLEARKPVAGTVSQGSVPNSPLGIDQVPYPYPNTNEGYAAAASLKNPLEKSAANIESGKVIYSKMCVHCHGAKGDGKGSLIVGGDPFPVPSYYDAAHLAVAEGQMFHSIHYGKNMMGSHASQLSKEERWKLVMYVQELQKQGVPSGAAVADTTAKQAVKK